jgi:hypothetical protein
VTWLELRERLNAAIPDDAVIVVANLELAWRDGDDGACFDLSWNEPATPPARKLARIGKL